MESARREASHVPIASLKNLFSGISKTGFCSTSVSTPGLTSVSIVRSLINDYIRVDERYNIHRMGAVAVQRTQMFKEVLNLGAVTDSETTHLAELVQKLLALPIQLPDNSAVKSGSKATSLSESEAVNRVVIPDGTLFSITRLPSASVISTTISPDAQTVMNLLLERINRMRSIVANQRNAYEAQQSRALLCPAVRIDINRSLDCLDQPSPGCSFQMPLYLSRLPEPLNNPVSEYQFVLEKADAAERMASLRNFSARDRQIASAIDSHLTMLVSCICVLCKAAQFRDALALHSWSPFETFIKLVEDFVVCKAADVASNTARNSDSFHGQLEIDKCYHSKFIHPSLPLWAASHYPPCPVRLNFEYSNSGLVSPSSTVISSHVTERDRQAVIIRLASAIQQSHRLPSCTVIPPVWGIEMLNVLTTLFPYVELSAPLTGTLARPDNSTTTAGKNEQHAAIEATSPLTLSANMSVSLSRASPAAAGGATPANSGTVPLLPDTLQTAAVRLVLDILVYYPGLPGSGCYALLEFLTPLLSHFKNCITLMQYEPCSKDSSANLSVNKQTPAGHSHYPSLPHPGWSGGGLSVLFSLPKSASFPGLLKMLGIICLSLIEDPALLAGLFRQHIKDIFKFRVSAPSGVKQPPLEDSANKIDGSADQKATAPAATPQEPPSGAPGVASVVADPAILLAVSPRTVGTASLPASAPSDPVSGTQSSAPTSSVSKIIPLSEFLALSYPYARRNPTLYENMVSVCCSFVSVPQPLSLDGFSKDGHLEFLQLLSDDEINKNLKTSPVGPKLEKLLLRGGQKPPITGLPLLAALSAAFGHLMFMQFITRQAPYRLSQLPPRSLNCSAPSTQCVPPVEPFSASSLQQYDAHLKSELSQFISLYEQAGKCPTEDVDMDNRHSVSDTPWTAIRGFRKPNVLYPYALTPDSLIYLMENLLVSLPALKSLLHVALHSFPFAENKERSEELSVVRVSSRENQKLPTSQASLFYSCLPSQLFIVSSTTRPNPWMSTLCSTSIFKFFLKYGLKMAMTLALPVYSDSLAPASFTDPKSYPDVKLRAVARIRDCDTLLRLGYVNCQSLSPELNKLLSLPRPQSSTSPLGFAATYLLRMSRFLYVLALTSPDTSRKICYVATSWLRFLAGLSETVPMLTCGSKQVSLEVKLHAVLFLGSLISKLVTIAPERLRPTDSPTEEGNLAKIHRSSEDAVAADFKPADMRTMRECWIRILPHLESVQQYQREDVTLAENVVVKMVELLSRPVFVELAPKAAISPPPSPTPSVDTQEVEILDVHAGETGSEVSESSEESSSEDEQGVDVVMEGDEGAELYVEMLSASSDSGGENLEFLPPGRGFPPVDSDNDEFWWETDDDTASDTENNELIESDIVDTGAADEVTLIEEIEMHSDDEDDEDDSDESNDESDEEEDDGLARMTESIRNLSPQTALPHEAGDESSRHPVLLSTSGVQLSLEDLGDQIRGASDADEEIGEYGEGYTDDEDTVPRVREDDMDIDETNEDENVRMEEGLLSEDGEQSDRDEDMPERPNIAIFEDAIERTVANMGGNMMRTADDSEARRHDQASPHRENGEGNESGDNNEDDDEVDEENDEDEEEDEEDEDDEDEPREERVETGFERDVASTTVHTDPLSALLFSNVTGIPAAGRSTAQNQVQGQLFITLNAQQGGAFPQSLGTFLVGMPGGTTHPTSRTLRDSAGGRGVAQARGITSATSGFSYRPGEVSGAPSGAPMDISWLSHDPPSANANPPTAEPGEPALSSFASGWARPNDMMLPLPGSMPSAPQSRSRFPATGGWEQIPTTSTQPLVAQSGLQLLQSLGALLAGPTEPRPPGISSSGSRPGLVRSIRFLESAGTAPRRLQIIEDTTAAPLPSTQPTSLTAAPAQTVVESASTFLLDESEWNATGPALDQLGPPALVSAGNQRLGLVLNIWSPWTVRWFERIARSSPIPGGAPRPRLYPGAVDDEWRQVRNAFRQGSQLPLTAGVMLATLALACLRPLGADIDLSTASLEADSQVESLMVNALRRNIVRRAEGGNMNVAGEETSSRIKDLLVAASQTLRDQGTKDKDEHKKKKKKDKKRNKTKPPGEDNKPQDESTSLRDTHQAAEDNSVRVLDEDVDMEGASQVPSSSIGSMPELVQQAPEISLSSLQPRVDAAGATESHPVDSQVPPEPMDQSEVVVDVTMSEAPISVEPSALSEQPAPIAVAIPAVEPEVPSVPAEPPAPGAPTLSTIVEMVDWIRANEPEEIQFSELNLGGNCGVPGFTDFCTVMGVTERQVLAACNVDVSFLVELPVTYRSEAILSQLGELTLATLKGLSAKNMDAWNRRAPPPVTESQTQTTVVPNHGAPGSSNQMGTQPPEEASAPLPPTSSPEPSAERDPRRNPITSRSVPNSLLRVFDDSIRAEFQSILAGEPQPAAPPAEREGDLSSENALFMASLNEPLRREVLMTADADFLATLPPDIYAEALLLRSQHRIDVHSLFDTSRRPRAAPPVEHEPAPQRAFARRGRPMGSTGGAFGLGLDAGRDVWGSAPFDFRFLTGERPYAIRGGSRGAAGRLTGTGLHIGRTPNRTAAGMVGDVTSSLGALQSLFPMAVPGDGAASNGGISLDGNDGSNFFDFLQHLINDVTTAVAPPSTEPRPPTGVPVRRAGWFLEPGHERSSRSTQTGSQENAPPAASPNLQLLAHGRDVTKNRLWEITQGLFSSAHQLNALFSGLTAPASTLILAARHWERTDPECLSPVITCLGIAQLVSLCFSSPQLSRKDLHRTFHNLAMSNIRTRNQLLCTLMYVLWIGTNELRNRRNRRPRNTSSNSRFVFPPNSCNPEVNIPTYSGVFQTIQTLKREPRETAYEYLALGVTRVLEHLRSLIAVVPETKKFFGTSILHPSAFDPTSWISDQLASSFARDEMAVTPAGAKTGADRLGNDVSGASFGKESPFSLASVQDATHPRSNPRVSDQTASGEDDDDLLHSELHRKRGRMNDGSAGNRIPTAVVHPESPQKEKATALARGESSRRMCYPVNVFVQMLRSRMLRQSTLQSLHLTSLLEVLFEDKDKNKDKDSERPKEKKHKPNVPTDASILSSSLLVRETQSSQSAVDSVSAANSGPEPESGAVVKKKADSPPISACLDPKSGELLVSIIVWGPVGRVSCNQKQLELSMRSANLAWTTINQIYQSLAPGLGDGDVSAVRSKAAEVVANLCVHSKHRGWICSTLQQKMTELFLDTTAAIISVAEHLNAPSTHGIGLGTPRHESNDADVLLATFQIEQLMGLYSKLIIAVQTILLCNVTKLIIPHSAIEEKDREAKSKESSLSENTQQSNQDHTANAQPESNSVVSAVAGQTTAESSSSAAEAPSAPVSVSGVDAGAASEQSTTRQVSEAAPAGDLDSTSSRQKQRRTYGASGETLNATKKARSQNVLVVDQPPTDILTRVCSFIQAAEEPSSLWQTLHTTLRKIAFVYPQLEFVPASDQDQDDDASTHRDESTAQNATTPGEAGFGGRRTAGKGPGTRQRDTEDGRRARIAQNPRRGQLAAESANRNRPSSDASPQTQNQSLKVVVTGLPVVLSRLLPLLELYFAQKEFSVGSDMGFGYIPPSILMQPAGLPSLDYPIPMETTQGKVLASHALRTYGITLFENALAKRLADPESELPQAHEEVLRFCEIHQKALNGMIRQQPVLLNSSFLPMLRLAPMFVWFDNKRHYFRQRLKMSKEGIRYEPLKLNLRRDQVFVDSFHQLRFRTAHDMKGKLFVRFHDEEGLDAGGLTREWYSILAREIFNPDYALFRREGSKAEFNHPNRVSFVNSEHLSFFQFIGRVLGKAVYDGQLLDAYFTRPFYKMMLGRKITPQDADSIDPEFYKSLQVLLDNPIDDMGLDLTFSTEVDEFGKTSQVELKPGGSSMLVNDSNKQEYVRLLCEHKIMYGLDQQIEAFLKGFYELIPPSLLSIFDDKELELLISGMPTIDLADLKAHTDYRGYTLDSEQIKWFWEILHGFDQNKLAMFLQFATGTSRVPLEGFRNLMGMRGPQQFSIVKAFGDDRLPSAHTCFNQLDLPEYSSKELMEKKLVQAITEGKEKFLLV